MSIEELKTAESSELEILTDGSRIDGIGSAVPFFVADVGVKAFLRNVPLAGESWFAAFYFDSDGLRKIRMTTMPHSSDDNMVFVFKALQQKYGEPTITRDVNCKNHFDNMSTEAHEFHWDSGNTIIEFDWHSYCDGEPYPNLTYFRGVAGLIEKI